MSEQPQHQSTWPRTPLGWFALGVDRGFWLGWISGAPVGGCAVMFLWWWHG